MRESRYIAALYRAAERRTDGKGDDFSKAARAAFGAAQRLIGEYEDAHDLADALDCLAGANRWNQPAPGSGSRDEREGRQHGYSIAANMARNAKHQR